MIIPCVELGNRSRKYLGTFPVVSSGREVRGDLFIFILTFYTFLALYNMHILFFFN